ncbi:hypothetical protein [Caenibius sp. WL]|uniref:hypothetical protein n=1 Tax=Caenibius sp. WL TaxID=2872646 RepID=UPI001C996999|nr:hypothetical protein [Caenibius sp. WL]QZP08489.1 hypothetical protein K5X80_01300 [Caenibius sp. WL]
MGSTGAAIVGGGLAAAAGSVASQMVGLATGLQDKFSFKGVALSALSGGVSGGIGSSGLFGGIKNGALQAGLRGLAGSAATQGIAVATGLQSKFDFAGVAAAGVGAGLRHTLGSKLNLQPLNGGGADLSFSNIAGHTLTGTANAIANAATRSAINGESFGNNLMRALPDAIGNTVGNALAGAIAGDGHGRIAAIGDAGADQPINGESGYSVGSGLGINDITIDLQSRLDAQVMLTAAGGDIQRARVMLMEGFGPTLEQASASASRLGELVKNVALSGGGYGGISDAVIGTGDHWNRGMTSFGHLEFTDQNMTAAKWVENTAVMERSQTALAEFDTELLRAGLAPFDIAAGGYNILTGNGGLRDYLAVGGIVPVGKALGAIGRAAKSTPIWSQTAKKSSVENAFGHWQKHGSEFPEFVNSKQYVEGAKRFFDTPPVGTLTKTRPNGDRIFYNPNTNTFGVQAPDGAPRTMFKPRNGPDYWSKQ